MSNTTPKHFAMVEDAQGRVQVVQVPGLTGVRRNKQVNYGTTVNYNTNPQIHLTTDANNLTRQAAGLQATFGEPTALTVYVQATLANINAAYATSPCPILPIAVVTWANGGAQHSMPIDATQPRGKVSIVAEYVDVTVCFQISSPEGPPVPPIVPAPTAQFTIELGGAVDPDFAHNTRLFPSPVPFGNGGGIDQPCRLASISAWDTSATGGNFLMLFDQLVFPPNGSLPIITWPLPAAPDVLSVDIGQATDLNFAQGLIWAVSTTSDTLTSNLTAKVRTDITVER